MGHNLNITNGKVAFASARKAAWHNLGQVIDKEMNTLEAIKFGGLDYEVEKVPNYAHITIREPELDKMGNVIREGEYLNVEAEGSYATVRKDTNQVLGVVGEIYKVLQNSEAFTFFDSFLEESDACIETVGALGKGERIFISAKMPEHISVLGKKDLIEQNVLVTTSHNGKTPTIVMFTPVRVVCQNTLNAALSGKSTNRIKIRHTDSQIEKLKLAHQVLGLNNQYTSEISEIFERLANKKADEELYEQIIVHGLADKKNPKDFDMVKRYFDKDAKQSTRFRRNVQQVMDYAYGNPTQLTPATKGTAFGAYNAITGYYQNEIEWKDENKKMEDIIDFNGHVFLKQQQAFDRAMQSLEIDTSREIQEIII